MWKPIETAPKDATHILVCKANDADGKPMGESFGLFVQRAAWWEGEGWVVYCSLIREPVCFFEPSHWMEIPPPPLPDNAALRGGEAVPLESTVMQQMEE